MATLDELSVVVTGDTIQMRQALGQAEAQMQRFERSASRSLGSVDLSFTSLRRTAETALRSLSVIAPSLAIGLSLRELSQAALAANREFANLLRTAERLGVTTDFFQGLRFAVEETGGEVSAVDSAMIVFGNTLAETRRGASGLASTLERLDAQALAAVRAARTQEEAFGAVADAVARASTQLERNEIAQAAFGRSGLMIERALREGADGIDRFIASAREMGVTVDEQLLRRADETERRFAVAGRVLDTQFKEALIELTPVLVETGELLAALLREVNDLVDGFRALDERRTRNLQADLAEARLRVEQLAAAQERLMTGGEEVDRRLARRGTTRVEALRLNNDLLMDAIARAKQIEDILAQRDREGEALAPSAADAGDAKEGEAALRALIALRKEHLRVTEQTAALIRIEENEQLESFREMLDKQLISAEQFEEARLLLADITARRLAELNEQSRKEIEEIARALESNLSSAFRNFVETGQLDFNELSTQIVADLAQIAFRLAILRPLLGGGPDAGTGLFGQVLGQVLHDGGVAGEAGPRRGVPALAFAGAQRFHEGGIAGLRPGEIPAILERGERVIPRGGDEGRRGPGVVVNISTPDVEGFRRNRGEIGAQIARAASRGQRNL